MFFVRVDFFVDVEYWGFVMFVFVDYNDICDI